MRPDGGPTIEQLEIAAYRIPTDAPESDGTLEWDSTSLVLVEVHAGGAVGLGYSYTHEAAALGGWYALPGDLWTASCALASARHVESFHDHVRIGRLLFDGPPEVVGGCLRPDTERAGHELVLKRSDAAAYRV